MGYGPVVTAESIIAAIAAAVAVVAALYASWVAWRLQERDHAHTKALQAQQQAHEQRMSELETKVQADIRDHSAEMVRRSTEMVEIERSRDEAAERAAGTAKVNVELLPGPYASNTSFVILNRGPATARNIELTIHGPVPGDQRRTPDVVNPDDFPSANLLPPEQERRLQVELFGGSGCDLEWSWEDGRSGRQTERQVLRLQVHRSGKVW